MQSKILLVDDEPELLEILSLVIESEFDCHLVTASSGNEAIQLLNTDQNIDLIISDYSMPNGTGGAIFQFNRKNKNLPFILVTGGFYDEYDDIADFFTVNSKNQIISKPMDQEVLIGAIRIGLGA